MAKDVSSILDKEHKLTENLEKNISELNELLNKKKEILRNLAETASLLETGESDIEAGFEHGGKNNIRKARRIIDKLEDVTEEYEELTRSEEEIFPKLEDEEQGIEELHNRVEQAEEKHLETH